MRCEEVLELLSAKLDGELDPQTDAALSRHLETCEECRRIWEVYREMDAGIAALEAEPPAELYTGVMEKISQTPVIKPVKKRRPMWGIGTLAAAAAALVLLVGTGTVDLPSFDQARNASSAVAEEAVFTETTEESLDAAAPAEAACVPETAAAEEDAAQLLPAAEEAAAMSAWEGEFDLPDYLSRQTMSVAVFEAAQTDVQALLQQWEELDWLEVPADLAQWQTVTEQVWSCETSAELARQAADQFGGTWYESAEPSEAAQLLLICR